MVNAAEPKDDPALAPFLDLLARDLTARPATITPLTETLAQRLTNLTQGVPLDPDAPIEGDVAL